MKTPIISIDWDHTFRNMHGLDLNILTLICYANAKGIPVGLTTHRDIENTTLYSMYQKPENNKIALAAAINYWQRYFLDAINIKCDFINARYQPNYHNENYYEKVVLPHEMNLAFEIKQKNLLDNPEAINKIISQYQQKEGIINNNEFKGSQINWLSNHYENKFNGTIYHIDDSHEVCNFLLDEFQKMNPASHIKINTIFYNKSPMFYNEKCGMLLEDIGLFADWESFLKNGCAPSCNNNLLYLSLCLLATQIGFTDTDILNKTRENLSKLTLLDAANNELIALIQDIVNKIEKNIQPIHFFLNEWVDINEE